MQVHQWLAQIVADEGVSCHFTLLGDANMYFADSLDALGVQSVHVRHEHCACSMAMSHARATGDLGFCSVTCGPGVTQLATALPAALRAKIPMVIFAGESPLEKAWYNQQLDQGPLVQSLGVEYVPIHTVEQITTKMREAFVKARLQQRPVVVGVPMDLQHKDWDGPKEYIPSLRVMPKQVPLHPAPSAVESAAQMIAAADKLILVAGRGVLRAGAAEACVALADKCGALLATTLPARGLFVNHPFDLGVAGGFSSEIAREKFAQADLVIAVGASLAQHTRDAGKLFGQAKVIQIDLSPEGINQGAVVADAFVQGDAAVSTSKITEAIEQKGTWRSDNLQHRIASSPSDSAKFVEDGYLDPRDVVMGLQDVLPKQWEMVNSSGHCSYFSAQMRGWAANNFHVIREFGAIGNGLSYAIGVAAARPDNTVVLIDGDGSLMMHAQELETIRRHGFKILICILNDGAYGSEIHKLRSEGLDDGGAQHGRGDLGAVARGFGLGGKVLTDLSDLQIELNAFAEGNQSVLWDFHVSDQIASPVMRRNHPAKSHG